MEVIDRKAFIGGAAAMLAAGCSMPARCTGRRPIRLEKLGTYDMYIVEANPVVFKGRLWLFEYIRWLAQDNRYRLNDTGESYFRFRNPFNLAEVTPPFGKGLHMGCAFVDGDRVVVTAVEKWGGQRFFQLESNDLLHWTEPRVILENAVWKGFNTTMCKADGRYVLAFELDGPKDLVGSSFTMFFAESKDLVKWDVVKGARMGADFYTGAPALKHHGEWFYFFHLQLDGSGGYVTRVSRSRNLFDWEFSGRVVLGYDIDDKRFYPSAVFSDADKACIAAAKDVNASDLDMCDWDGRLFCFYSWGNQRGNEFSAFAEADCTEREFCESFF